MHRCPTIDPTASLRSLLAILQSAIKIYAYEIFTFALKGISRRRQEQFVSHRGRLHAPGYAGLHVIFLHPLCQPPHAAVAVKRVGPQGAVNIVIDKVAGIENPVCAVYGTILTDAL